MAAEEEEDYITMEITPFSSSSPPSKDFEFPHSSSSSASASDLFYRGKLRCRCPPPPFLSAPCTTSNTPFDSCNISPSESCRPSCDLNPTAALFTDITTFFFNNHPRNNNSWPSKMKLNKRSYLAHKLRSSRAFLKSLFAKADAASFGKKLIKKKGFDDHRRSFSGAIAASDSSSSSTSSSSSSSSSFNSSVLHQVEVQFVGRSSSAAEIEVSIDAAIAHCKKSFATS